MFLLKETGKEGLEYGKTDVIDVAGAGNAGVGAADRSGGGGSGAEG